MTRCPTSRAPAGSCRPAVDAFGQIDIVVNNAGIVRDRTLVKMDESDFDAVIATHLKGTFNVVRHAAPHMKDQGWGRIVNITSSAGLRGNFGQTNYAAAKAGIMGMTFVWALELGKYGICVNAVAPAGVTRMTGSLADGDDVPPTLDPSLNAPLVVFLGSDKAAGVNGQILGRTDFSYTLFQHPKQIAWMHREGGWDVEGVAEQFDATLGQHLQTGRHGHAVGPLAGQRPQVGSACGSAATRCADVPGLAEAQSTYLGPSTRCCARPQDPRAHPAGLLGDPAQPAASSATRCWPPSSAPWEDVVGTLVLTQPSFGSCRPSRRAPRPRASRGLDARTRRPTMTEPEAARPFRVLPAVVPENEHFWTGGAEGELRFLRCDACGWWLHPPADLPECLSRELSVAAVSGDAVVHTFTVN